MIDIKGILEKYRNNVYFHAFATMLVTAGIFVLFISICNITPFGNSTWLIYDMKRQYVDFYSYYKTILSGDNNLFYAPAMTLGSGAIGFFTYYLSSPFLLILSVFNRNNILVAITLMIGMKLALSALNCDLFLQNYLANQGEQKVYRTLLFSITYPLCAYMISNCINPMWLDVFMCMPLVVCMLDRLLQNNAKFGYIISLAYILWCNYYISYMVCLFIVMWTVYRLVMQPDQSFRKIVRVAACSIWAVGVDAVLLIPTAIELSGSPKDIFQLGLKAIKGNLSLREIMSKLWFAAYNSSQTMFGTPLIYMGTIVLFLTILYFLNDRICLKERICMLIMIVIFVVSFAIDKINLLWHAGMEPSGYPYREAFLMVFLCIICSCKCFGLYMEGITFNKMCISIAVILAMMAYSFSGGYKYILLKIVQANIVLVMSVSCIFLLYLHAKKNIMKKYLGVCLIMIQIMELFVNGVFIYKQQTSANMMTQSDYKQSVEENAYLVGITQGDEDSYRVENMKPREHNDSMMFNYAGVTHYSSAGSIYTRQFLKKFGFNDDRLHIYYGNSNTYTADSLLGIRYLIGATEYRLDYKEIMSEYTGVRYNPFAMSIAYSVGRISEYSENNPFELQESMYGDILGSDVSLFEEAYCRAEEVVENNIRHNMIECTTEHEGYVYFYLDCGKGAMGTINIYVDGEFFSNYGDLSCYKVLNLGYYDKGDVINVDIVSDANVGYDSYHIVTENVDSLESNYKIAKDKNLLTRMNSSSEYELTLMKDMGEDSVGIATTIPYEKEWRIYADGKAISYDKIYDTFIYIPATELENVKEGSVIIMRYVSLGAIVGSIISCMAVTGLLLLMILGRRKKKNI